MKDQRKGGRPTKSEPLNQRLRIIMSEVIGYLSERKQTFDELTTRLEYANISDDKLFCIPPLRFDIENIDQL